MTDVIPYKIFRQIKTKQQTSQKRYIRKHQIMSAEEDCQGSVQRQSAPKDEEGYLLWLKDRFLSDTKKTLGRPAETPAETVSAEAAMLEAYCVNADTAFTSNLKVCCNYAKLLEVSCQTLLSDISRMTGKKLGSFGATAFDRKLYRLARRDNISYTDEDVNNLRTEILSAIGIRCEGIRQTSDDNKKLMDNAYALALSWTALCRLNNIIERSMYNRGEFR